MAGDTLSDLLRAVRLRGALFFYIEGLDPWVAESAHGSELVPLILPGVDHLMEFHGVVSGSCWTAIVGQEPIRLYEGDFVLFPQGDAHVVSSAPGMRSTRGSEARSGLNGRASQPRKPQITFACSRPPPSRCAVVAPGAGLFPE